MSHLDIILLILLGGFMLFGLWFGLVHALGSLIGTIVGSFLAGHYYAPLTDWILPLTGGNPNLIKVLVFIFLFIIGNRLVGFVFWIIEKIFGVLKILPFLSTIDHLLGGVFGLLEGVLVIGLTLYFISKFPFSEWLTGAMLTSGVAAYLIKVSALLLPLLPDALKAVQGVF
ncbi:MAG: CvpA family protein [Candidatus Magasanikbacteria bacterium]|nr:CvpA family protein [Candidatus Magasanikbacteria bacterium]